MRNDDDLINAEHIDAMVRRAGEERAYYLGEAIGNVLLVAWEALESAGRWLRYSATLSTRTNAP